MTAASTPREVIAGVFDQHVPEWEDTRWRCQCGWTKDYMTSPFAEQHRRHLTDAILLALSEAGWTVARLELAGVMIGDEVFDDEPDAGYGDAPRLYRKLLPQEEEA